MWRHILSNSKTSVLAKFIPWRSLTLSIHRFVIAHHHIHEIIWWRLRPGSEATRVHGHRSLFVIRPWHRLVITINGLNFRGFWGRWRGPLSSCSLFNLTFMQNTLFSFRNLEFDLLEIKIYFWLKKRTLGVSPSLVSRYCEGYSFWSIWGP